eukprot:2278319-Pyramimonas_sp.AAC.1
MPVVAIRRAARESGVPRAILFNFRACHAADFFPRAMLGGLVQTTVASLDAEVRSSPEIVYLEASLS